MHSGIIENPEENYKISTDEKVQIARETNRIRMPREITKWLQSLDLSYKIKIVNRDLANGFSIAEILSRYPIPYTISLPYNTTNYYRVNMQEFSNGISYKERLTNWKHIKDILKRYQMPYPEDLPTKVLNYAPNAAFEFLCLLYKFLTKRDLTVLNKIDETDKFRNYTEFEMLPPFMRPTANALIRDKETQRIPDDLVRKFKIENIIQNHNTYLQNERDNLMKMDQLYKSQKVKLKKIDPNTLNSKISSAMKQEKFNTQPEKSDLELNEQSNESQSRLLSNDGIKEERINLLGILTEISDESREQENVINEFKMLIRKNFIETDRNVEMNLKNYPPDKDILEYFFEQINLSEEENLNKIFVAYEDKEKEFIGIISRTLIELDPFIKITCEFFEALKKNNKPHHKFKESTLRICRAIRDITKDKCDNVFLNFCIDYLLDMISKNPLYRNEICEIIFALTSNTNETHYQILKKVSKKFLHTNEVLFYHVLVQCLENTNENEADEVISDDILFFYSNAISKGLNSSNEIINIKSMYLVIQIMKFNFFFCLQYHNDIFKHSDSFNWEILSLILIYCSQILQMHNRQKVEKNHIFGALNENLNVSGVDQNLHNVEVNESGDKVENSLLEKINEKSLDKKSDKIDNLNKQKLINNKISKKSITNQNENSKDLNNNSNNLINNSKNSKEQKNDVNNSNHDLNIENSNQNIGSRPLANNELNLENQGGSNEMIQSQARENPENLAAISNIEEIEKDNDTKRAEEEYNIKINEIQKKEPLILNNIDKIFNTSSPHMTLKIGFIYLAEIIEYYPDLAKKYMKLLIEYKDDRIRKEVLEVKRAREENEYTINCFAEKYKFCGAPIFWDQLIVAGIFRDYIINEKLLKFERTHLMILKSIIINQKFDEEQTEKWILLYNDLKQYLFKALCDKEFSDIALSILDKLFGFSKILNELLNNTFDLFIETMKIIYGDDIMDAPHENMKALLSIISNLKTENGNCKEYVYKLIKTFAIENDKKYLKSNLLKLMNDISNEKRGKIFEN